MKHYTESETEFLIENYSNRGLRYCSEYLNRDMKSIQKKAMKLGLKVDCKTKSILRKDYVKKSWENRQDSLFNLNKKIKIDINELFLNKNFVYFLGYLWGDGYVRNCGVGKANTITIEITKDDGSDVEEKFMSFLNWNIYYRNRKNRKEQMSFTINNRVLTEYLILFNYGRKSFDYPTILDVLSFDMKRYFYLGLSDADGCFYHSPKHYTYQYHVSSTYEQNWKHMKDIFDYLEIRYTIKRKEIVRKSGNVEKHSIILISNKSDFIKFGDYIYSDNFIGLRRKFTKFVTAKEYEKTNI
jgi:hypothetical protein